MAITTMQKKREHSPAFMGGILPIERSRVPLDIVAGITLAALAIPEVMGYTKIAGMPVVTGLYTILIPMALFALFGSSRHLVVGADSATAAILAAGLAGLATTASPQYVAYAGILALLAALMLILARLIRLGFLADFLSRTVLIGFLTGVGIQVAVGQIAGMLGIPGGGAGPVQKLITDFQQLGQTNPYTLAISIVVLAIIAGSRRVNKKIPGALIAVIGAILVSYLVNLSSFGVAVLGTVPGGLPKIGLPAGVNLNMKVLEQLLAIAFSMFIVILAQSAATSRAYATHYSESFSENIDLVYYANTELFSQEVLELANSAQPPLAWFCIDAVAVDDIDFSAAATLWEIYQLLKEKGIRLVMAEVDDDIRRELDLSAVTGLIGKDFIFETVADIEDAYRRMIPGKIP